MKKPLKADLVCVLDKSGSMTHLREAALKGINEFIDSQKKVPGEANLTMVLFDTTYEELCSGINLAEARELPIDAYNPGGGTALLDAVGRALKDTEKRIWLMDAAERPRKVIISIMTDGEENASREYSWQKIKDMIAACRKKGWEFNFMGATERSMANALEMGIDRKSSMRFNATQDGTRGCFCTLSAMNASSRSRMVDRPSKETNPKKSGKKTSSSTTKTDPKNKRPKK